MNLKNHFIVAMPSITDPLFKRSVIYICEHNRDGAMGLIINKPIPDITVDDILLQLDLLAPKDCQELNQPVFMGGPMADEQGFILHHPQEGFASSIKISDDMMITISLDLIQSIATPQQPTEFFISLGYSSWQPLQLETEVARNDWLVTKADSDIIFSCPIEDRWQQAANSLGININTISQQMGNA